jgi:hypothetical protein
MGASHLLRGEPKSEELYSGWLTAFLLVCIHLRDRLRMREISHRVFKQIQFKYHSIYRMLSR